MSNEPHFDECQFASRFRRKREHHNLSFADRRSMQFEERVGHRLEKWWIPPFANDDKLLRIVVSHKVWDYICRGWVRKPMPEGIGRRELEARSVLAFWHSRWKPEHAYAVFKCGSPAELFARVLWLSWRERLTSEDVGSAVGLSGVAVRQIVRRGLDIARKLGFETRAPHWTAQKPKPSVKLARFRDPKFLEAASNPEISLAGLTRMFSASKPSIQGALLRARKSGLLHRKFKKGPPRGFRPAQRTPTTCQWPTCNTRAMGREHERSFCAAHLYDVRNYRNLAIHLADLAPRARLKYEQTRTAFVTMRIETAVTTFGEWMEKKGRVTCPPSEHVHKG